MTHPTRVGISVFAFAAILGPVYTVDGYSAVSNVISELGAQHTQNNLIMILAFMVLGAAIAFDGLRCFQLQLLPFILYGLLMGIVGLFPHRPLDPLLDFSAMRHQLHGIVAGLAGVAITVGFIWQGIVNSGTRRGICFYMAGVSTLLPILMLSFPSIQGVIQRLMYLQILGWLWMRYPMGKLVRETRHTEK